MRATGNAAALVPCLTLPPGSTIAKGGKYIYVARDPMDAFVSFYNFLPGYMGLQVTSLPLHHPTEPPTTTLQPYSALPRFAGRRHYYAAVRRCHFCGGAALTVLPPVMLMAGGRR